MLDRNKDAQATILNDLQTEVKSLKSLLLSRRPATALLDGAASSSPSVTSPPAVETNGISPRLSATFNSSARPAIPSWQMASKTAPAATENKPSVSSEKQPATDEPAETVADSKAEVKEQ
jgi:peroxin-14